MMNQWIQWVIHTFQNHEDVIAWGGDLSTCWWLAKLSLTEGAAETTRRSEDRQFKVVPQFRIVELAYNKSFTPVFIAIKGFKTTEI